MYSYNCVLFENILCLDLLRVTYTHSQIWVSGAAKKWCLLTIFFLLSHRRLLILNMPTTRANEQLFGGTKNEKSKKPG